MPRRRFSLAALWLSMLWLLCLCLPARADRDDLNALQAPAPSQWQLIKDDKPRNIQIFSKREDHTRVRSMKAEAELPGSVAGMVDVLMDFERYPLWFWRLKEIRPLKQLSATEAYVYAVFSPPMGFPDRDVVLHYKAEIVRNGQRAMVTATSVPNLMPEQPGRCACPMRAWKAGLPMSTPLRSISKGKWSWIRAATFRSGPATSCSVRGRTSLCSIC